MHIFTSYADIQTMVANGDFDENHVLEAKRELTLGTPKKNNETAKDLAQFAFEGGTVVYGIDEHTEGGETTFSMHPVQLEKGIEERIEQIAQTRCRPPLSVRVRTMPQSEGSDQGCIVVEVPPSSRRPHMVDGRYPRRGEKTVEFLSDADVRVWVGQSEDESERVRTLLREHVAADPYTSGNPRTAHLFGVAIPLTSRSDDLPDAREAETLYHDAVAQFRADWPARFRHADRRSREHLSLPSLGGLSHEHPHDQERTMRSHQLHEYESQEGVVPDEESLAKWSIHATGAIRVYDAGFSSHRVAGNGREVHAAWLSAPAAVAGILVESARLAAERLNYHGEWGFGLAATGMRGARLRPDELFARYPVVSKEGFEMVCLRSGHDVATGPEAILDQLLTPAARMLGDEGFLERTA